MLGPSSLLDPVGNVSCDLRLINTFWYAQTDNKLAKKEVNCNLDREGSHDIIPMPLAIYDHI